MLWDTVKSIDILDHVSLSYHGAILVMCSLSLFQLTRIIYRLKFHPLAMFPGPRLAAATNLYTAYYDLVLDGSLVKQLPELHRIYGAFSTAS